MLQWLAKIFRSKPTKPAESSVPTEIEALRRMGNRGRPSGHNAPFVRPSGVVHEDFRSGRSEGEWGTILTRGNDGRPLSFDYAKRHGEQSSRVLFDWVEFPQHVQGICSERGAVLSFRKDRVSIWHGGCAAMLKAPKGKSRR